MQCSAKTGWGASPVAILAGERRGASRAVIVASPTSIKSFVLKFTEILHLLDEHANTDRPVEAEAGFGTGIMNFMGFGKKGPAAEQEVLLEL